MAEYFRRGVSKVLWGVAPGEDPVNRALPTTAELTAMDDITPYIAEMSGWEFANSPIPTPKLSTTFTTTIPGEDTSPNPELTIYDDDGTPSPDVRALCAKGNAGYIVLMPLGRGAGNPTNIFPVTSTGVNDDWTLGNESAKFGVTFAVSEAPTLEGVET